MASLVRAEVGTPAVLGCIIRPARNERLIALAAPKHRAQRRAIRASRYTAQAARNDDLAPRGHRFSDQPKIIMAQPSPLSVLSGALKIADKFTIAMEAIGSKIRLNCQGWEDVRVIGERHVLMVVAYKGSLYLLPEHKPAKFENIDAQGLHEAGYGPDDFE